MSLRLPDNLFTTHRLVEDGESIFRLSDTYRMALLAGNDTPLPAALPPLDWSALQSVPVLAQHLNGLYAHFIRLGDSKRLLEALIQQINQLARRAPDGCIAAIQLCPYTSYTAHHAINCALLAALIGENLQFSQAECTILIGSTLTMNLGSAEVQNQMSMQDGPPSTLQRQILDIHPLLSSAMLREVEMLDPLWHTAVLMHHERRDGRGYAFGVHDSEIPALARLIHLLDIVAAKLMPRSYRPSVAPKQALAALYAGEMESFDPLYITQLVKILGIYPPGSFIELQNGDHALVVKNGDSAATPLVVSIKSPDHPIDTAQAGYHVKQSVSLSLEARHLPLFYRYWS